MCVLVTGGTYITTPPPTHGTSVPLQYVRHTDCSPPLQTVRRCGACTYITTPPPTQTASVALQYVQHTACSPLLQTVCVFVQAFLALNIYQLSTNQLSTAGVKSQLSRECICLCVKGRKKRPICISTAGGRPASQRSQCRWVFPACPSPVAWPRPCHGVAG